MQDLLVPLYKLPMPPAESAEVVIRPVFPAEIRTAVQWVEQEFGAGWASEFEYAAGLSPVSSYVAIENGTLLGFVCINAAAKGVFGPTGVIQSARGKGIGTSLLLRALSDMRAQGYAYAIIGAAGPINYYMRTVGATIIKDGAPGFLGTLINKSAAPVSTIPE